MSIPPLKMASRTTELWLLLKIKHRYDCPNLVFMFFSLYGTKLRCIHLWFIMVTVPSKIVGEIIRNMKSIKGLEASCVTLLLLFSQGLDRMILSAQNGIRVDLGTVSLVAYPFFYRIKMTLAPKNRSFKTENSQTPFATTSHRRPLLQNTKGFLVSFAPVVWDVTQR